MTAEECDYCTAEFDDEETYLRHLQAEHADDLGPIEQRRVAKLTDDDDGGRVVMYAGAVGTLALVALLAYVLFFFGDGGTGTDNTGESADEPYALNSVHYHGTMAVTVGGQELDFSQQRFQMQADAFHFEEYNGQQWHVHAKGVTLGYAMETLGIEVTDDTVTYDGTTYGDDPGERATVEVNGESVNPSEYVLEEGDSIRIVAGTNESE